MKTETVDVKSQGKVVSKIEVEQFESMQEAIDTLNEKVCLTLVNRQYKSDKVNTERSIKTRGTSLQAQLTRALKGKTKEELADIIGQLGLGDEIDLDAAMGE